MVYNDRLILSVDAYGVEYDSPSVKIGQSRPNIEVNEFLHWSKSDVTNEKINNNQWVVT